jgi:hypothetical protein
MSPEMLRLAEAMMDQAAYESCSRGQAGIDIMYEAREESIKAIRAVTKSVSRMYRREMAQ